MVLLSTGGGASTGGWAPTNAAEHSGYSACVKGPAGGAGRSVSLSRGGKESQPKGSFNAITPVPRTKQGWAAKELARNQLRYTALRPAAIARFNG